MNGVRLVVQSGLWLSAVAVACASGTETDNPKDGNLVGFDSSACKKEAAEEAGKSQEGLAVESEHAGLTCIQWERQPDATLTLNLLNFHGGCSVPWAGEAAVQPDGSLDLTLVNTKCAVALCGWCIYDFRFEVKGVADVASLPLRVGFVACPGKETSWDYALTLPADAGDSGIVCRYANQYAYDEQLEREGRCGGKFGTCDNPPGRCGSVATSCADGLVCGDTGDEVSRCLETCEADADCTPSDVSSCVDGVCRVNAAF